MSVVKMVLFSPGVSLTPLQTEGAHLVRRMPDVRLSPDCQGTGNILHPLSFIQSFMFILTNEKTH